MLSLTEISLAAGTKLLFTDVSLNLLPGHRYGVVGSNGSGKSTFLHMLAGEEEPLSGEILKSKEAKIGWLKQNFDVYAHTRILDVVLGGKPNLIKALEEKEKILNHPHLDEQDCYRLAELEEIIAHEEGYTAEVLAKTLLTGLGIQERFFEAPLSHLSGGYQLRVLLAQALFGTPDILLLDEPTNHLDILSVSWLETFLKKEFKGILLFVSHDHDFLNQLATDILDIDYFTITHYVGNYEKFLEEKKAIQLQKLHDKKHIEDRIAELNTFVTRFKASATKAKQAASKAKMIERLKASLPTMDKTVRRTPYFQFPVNRPSGKHVLKVTGLKKSFEGSMMNHPVSFEIHRGEKIALIGPNGVGKSTLLKILMNLVTADTGKCEWGHEVQVAYFAQAHHEILHGHTTVLEWLETQASHASSVTVRNILGQMLFQKDDVYKRIASLSGGESARLLLAHMALVGGNCLILDEPTNHLDIESIDTLIHALQAYKGTIIFVSHNRHFIENVASRILAILPHTLEDFHGKYSAYLEKYKDLTSAF